MSTHEITRACPLVTFLLVLSRKWLSASGSNADLCGPGSIAACISATVQFHPVAVWQPYKDHSSSKSPVGWAVASHVGCMPSGFSLRGSSSQWSRGSQNFPWCVIHCVCRGWTSSCACHIFLLCHRMLSLVAPVSGAPFADVGGRRSWAVPFAVVPPSAIPC